MRFWKLDKKTCLQHFLVFAAGFLIGMLLLKYKENILRNQSGIFGDYYLEQYSFLEIDKRSLTWMLMKERGKWIIIMWALGFTGIGVFAVYVFDVLWGFLFSIVLSAVIFQQGLAGVGLVFLLVMPQALIYIPFWLWFLQVIADRSNAYRNSQKMGRIMKGNRQYVMSLIAGVGVFLLGILTESYLNSWLVQQILRFF